MERVGPYELYSIRTGTFRLDGGAMFGVVPKAMWERVTPADGMNRIALATRTLLALHRQAGRVVVVDSGCGTKCSPEMVERFQIEHNQSAITRELSKQSLTPDDVTDVVATHLHFDHNGGLVQRDENGDAVRLSFPKARHWIHRRHWDHAHAPTYKDRASFLREDFAALASSGLLEFVGDEDESGSFRVPPDLRWFVSQGHTTSQLLPMFGPQEQCAIFTGDVIPTVAHLRLSWVMAYDLRPLQTIEEKQRMLHEAIQHKALLYFPHDPVIAGGWIDGPLDRPIIVRSAT